MRIVPVELVELFLNTWERRTGDRPWDINRGWCYQFALILQRLHGDKSVKIHSTTGHAWVEINGLFYDAYTPEGATYPLDKNGHSGTEMTVEQLEEYWNGRGLSGPVNWEIIREVVDKFEERQVA